MEAMFAYLVAFHEPHATGYTVLSDFMKQIKNHCSKNLDHLGI